MIDVGFPLQANLSTLEFEYGKDVFGPKTEKQHLDDIRRSLSDPHVDGPDIVYAVAMDIGKEKDRQDLIERNLLYGAMIFEKGRVGKESVRSQGHVHAISPSCNDSTCEVYEIWQGAAYIYMQETTEDDPGRCYAVYGLPGDVIIVPPHWAHCTINADPSQAMLFGAWCVRDYGFDYTGVRAHQGVAYYPQVQKDGIDFVANPMYHAQPIQVVKTRAYLELGLQGQVPIYTQYEQDPNRFAFITHPDIAKDVWKNYHF
ncbi:glucose-6-phosphate isomerase family protein [Absicoccus intestinalis]|uniref:glucose-6-phosphate isomerase n=1 Tax=Absicoccus intestinalis TaxID=2926319 RepID=A0ABU4WMR5_9FIRM|nr:glucose-6-phosphate isomerase family protein [Absicoccus sp. CLA-KB-P134]MDX8417845.1 glucose-6-phosphate isomerase [Absicoccus sp. CLA-KB-P134]